jgi:hypothetical protein
MKTLLRISWLIAGTLLLSRFIASAVDRIFDLLSWYPFDLPSSFIQYLNVLALLAVSFAFISTLAWLIDNRKAYPLKENLRIAAVMLFVVVFVLGLYISVTPISQDWKSSRAFTAEYDYVIAEISSAISAARRSPPDVFDKIEAEKLLDSLEIPRSVKADALAAFLSAQTPQEFHDMFEKLPLPTETTAQLLDRKFGVTTVRIPMAAKGWSQHPKEELKSVDELRFSGAESDGDIMQVFEKYLLQPRPTFSLAAALRLHVWSLCTGLAVAALGLFGCVWLFSRRRSGKPDPLAA